MQNEDAPVRDSRSNPRFEVDAYVADADSKAYRIQNISLGGICIQTPSIEEVGSKVDLVINFPELSTFVEVTGEVVWVNRTDPKDMGIRYIGLDDSRRETLKRYIDRVQSGTAPPA